MRVSAQGGSRDNASHIAGLDGLRAVAVLTVVAFHFGLGWLPGGFFGVDVFYVLSGFLITGLLLAEWRRSSTVRLGAFWARRARRLLPCLALVLVVVSLCVRYLVPPDTYPGFRLDALSALFYFSNWWQIHTDSSYFAATGAASPLLHTWSLAIEEQFYLVWPVVVLLTLKLCRTYQRGVRTVMALAAAGAAASVVEMAVLFRSGASTTRLYFGTDTHAQCVLVGATLACGFGLLARRQGVEGLVPRCTAVAARRTLAIVGALGLAGVAVLSATVDGSSSFTYEGGFAVCALCTAAVIAAATCLSDGVLARALSVRPLVLLGIISYGVYLWHFPVDIFVTPARTGLSGVRLMGLQFSLTIAVATASYVVVERPILSGTFWRTLRSTLPTGAAVAATVGVIWAATVVPATAATSVRHFSPAADGAPPAKVAALGDSTAGVLEVALTATAPPGTTVVRGAIAGCGLAVATNSSNQMGKPEEEMFTGCNEHQPSEQLWPSRDAATVSDTGPGDVVLFLAGQWETQDLLMHGTWTNILQPSFQRYELHQLRTLVAVATAHGAHLDLLTEPAMESHGEYQDSGVADLGPPNPASDPRRRDMYNDLLQRTAAAYPGKVSVLDYGQLLSPRGTFTEYLDGVQVRSTDGVHTPAYLAGFPLFTDATPAVADAFYRWLSPRIWPAILASAHSGRSSSAVRLPPSGSGQTARDGQTRVGFTGPSESSGARRLRK